MKAANKHKYLFANSYPGGKNGAGVYQRLINQIPPHTTYIETHLGGGAIMRLKRNANMNIGVDIDPDVIKCWNPVPFPDEYPLFDCDGVVGSPSGQILVWNKDAVSFLIDWQKIRGSWERTFLFCDPPYLMETRKSGPLYRYEYTREQHIELLKLLLSLDAMVMITGYRSALYDEMLIDWRRVDYMAPTRQGLAPESAWMNYPQPTELHDYRYLGEDYRERERIRRKVQRWKKNLDSLPVLERRAILAAINSPQRRRGHRE